MRTAAILLLALLAWTASAQARLSKTDLERASVLPKPAASLPLDLEFRDLSGAPRTLGDAIGSTPAVLIFADYTCKTLCGPIVSFAADGLAHSGLRPGQDYRLIVVGLDPKDSFADAQKLAAAQVGASPVAQAAVFLSGDEASIRQATAAADYSFVYDADEDQFAHPAAALVVDPTGRVSRVLSGLALDGADLRLALVDAAQGRIGSLADHIRLLCYGFDPAQGIYTPLVMRWLVAGCILTLAALGGAVAWMSFRRSREALS